MRRSPTATAGDVFPQPDVSRLGAGSNRCLLILQKTYTFCLIVQIAISCSPPVHDNFAGDTDGALLSAIERRNIANVQTVLRRKPELVNKQIRYYTPLGSAVAKSEVEIVALLLDHGADVNQQIAYDGHISRSPLEEAVSLPPEREKEAYPITKMLLDRGANVNATSSSGDDVLHLATIGRSPGRLRLLLSKNPDMEKTDTAGSTPLHWAATFGWFDGVNILLEHGANPLSKDVQGRTPLQHAELHLRVVKHVGAKVEEVEETSRVVEILKKYEGKWEQRQSRP